MKDSIQQKGLDIPRFDIYGRKAALQLLRNYTGKNSKRGLRDDINSLLLTYQPPNVLARFWHRGGTNIWGKEGVEIPKDQIEWGYFYREMTSLIWDCVEMEETEGHLRFRRVYTNPDHVLKKFYYKWEVSKDGSSSEMPEEFYTRGTEYV